MYEPTRWTLELWAHEPDTGCLNYEYVSEFAEHDPWMHEPAYWTYRPDAKFEPQMWLYTCLQM